MGRKFIAYLAIAHQQSRHRLKARMAENGGYILHLDGTCESDSPHLFTGMDGIFKIGLENVNLPSEKGELIIPFLRNIEQAYGKPIVLVHDIGQGILSAIFIFCAISARICWMRNTGKSEIVYKNTKFEVS